MTTVTKESLETWIRRLERDKEIQGALSIREEFYLAVMNDLLGRMVDDAEWSDKFHMDSDDD